MAMVKISSFLAIYALVVCQMESYHAVPVRAGLEPVTDQGNLGEYETRRLVNALVKEYAKMKAEKAEQPSEGNSLNRPISKRCANLSTCTFSKLLQDLEEMKKKPPTDVGPDTPGKKRSVLNDFERERYANYEEALGSK